MAKMRWSRDVDWNELEETEYTEDDFVPYEGPTPPTNTILNGYIKKVWATETSNGDDMLKALFIADGNEGERKIYDGCPVWENVLFTMPQVKFRWQPFLDAVGITLSDLRSKTVTGDEENTGLVITRIGPVRFDGRDPVEARIMTKREKDQNNDDQVRVGRWLPPLEAEQDDEDDEDDYDPEDDDFVD